jgi:hypothetical protein
MKIIECSSSLHRFAARILTKFIFLYFLRIIKISMNFGIYTNLWKI